jgi:hypothetical protein
MNPGVAIELRKNVKAFYDLRSGIVHGGRRRGVTSNEASLEGIDSHVLLLLLTISANTDRWHSFSTILDDIETLKWGAGDTCSRDRSLRHDCPEPWVYLKRKVSRALSEGLRGRAFADCRPSLGPQRASSQWKRIPRRPQFGETFNERTDQADLRRTTFPPDDG